MSRFFAGLGRFSVRFRWVIVAVWLVGTIVMTTTLPSLASVAKDTQSGFLPANAPSVAAENLASPFQNVNYAASTLVASRTNSPLTSADLAALSRLDARISATANVKLVHITGSSVDQEAIEVEIEANVPQYGTGDAPALVSAIRADFTSVDAPAGLHFNLTGDLPTIVDEATQSEHSQGLIQLLSILFIIVLLLLAFRAALAPLVTLIPPVLVVALSSPVIALATHIGVQASSITELILVVLVLGAGTDYGLFLVFRTREEMRNGLSSHEAVAKAVSTVGESITFSALIVMAALTSLITAQFGFYQSLGPALAIGIALMLLAGLTLLPAMLAILGRAVFWPTSVKQVAVQRPGLWSRIATRLIRRPVATLCVGLVLLVGLAAGSLGVATAGFADQATAASGTDSAAGAAVIAAHFPATGAFPTEVLFTFSTSIWTHPQTLASMEQDLRATGDYSLVLTAANPESVPLPASQLVADYKRFGPPQRLSVQPPAGVNPLAYSEYRATAEYISTSGRTVQALAVPLKNDSSNPADIAYTPTLRAHVATVATELGAQKNGIFSLNALAYDVSSISSSDLDHIIPLVTIVIALLLAVVLRSLGAPLYLVPSVVLSYFAALGLVAVIFVDLGGQSGIQFVLPFLMFIFLMALGSDYNVLVMTRIREERRHRPLREAVAAAVGATGTTVTTAGIVLGGTFVVLAVAGGGSSGGGQIQQIGFGIALGVLLDTFLVRTVIVPSIVVLLGRANWWPSRMWRVPVDHFEDEELTSKDAAA